MSPVLNIGSQFATGAMPTTTQTITGTAAGGTNAATSGLVPGSTGLIDAGSAINGDGFTQSLVNAIGSVSGLQTNADQAVSGLALNNGTDISQAMIAMEQASLGMSLAVQVRDKAVEAYQTLMNMQM